MLFNHKTPKDEAREAGRYEVPYDLDVVYDGSTERLPVHFPDLSTGGMFIHTPEQFSVGSILKLHLRLINSGQELNARAKVCHYVPAVGIGVEFIDLSPEALYAIEEEIRAIAIRVHP